MGVKNNEQKERVIFPDLLALLWPFCFRGFLFEDAFSFISVRRVTLPMQRYISFNQKKVSVREERGALNSKEDRWIDVLLEKYISHGIFRDRVVYVMCHDSPTTSRCKLLFVWSYFFVYSRSPGWQPLTCALTKRPQAHGSH